MTNPIPRNEGYLFAVAKVEGTPLDFRAPKRIGDSIDAAAQIGRGGGSEQDFALRGGGALR